MKKITLILLLSMVTIFAAEAHKYKNRNAHITISIQSFYDELSPYGDWIYSPDYGYVWRPYFDNPESFRPYSSNGNWVYTEYGWTWASDYNWGWATFHYGRWDFDNYLGWMWIPGYEWAPAWVTWGSYDNYWGWAPLGPNIYIQVNTNWYAPDPWWTFVPRRHFCSGNWNHYIYDRPVHITNITHITNVYVNNSNNNTWYNGPRVSEVERFSSNRVRRMEIAESRRPENAGVRDNRLDVYRPTVDKSRKDSRPSEYRRVENVRTDRKMEQTNARSNNPGVNRTRENRTETRRTNQVSTQNRENVNSQNRVDPRTSKQGTGTRSNGVVTDSRTTNRNTSQTAPRTGSVNHETRVTPGNGPNVSTERSSTRQATETKRENSNREIKSQVPVQNRPAANPARVENTENRQPRNTSPASVNDNSKSARESGNTQSSANRPSTEQRTKSAAPAADQRKGNQERKEVTREVVKQADGKKSAETPDKGTSGKPVRR
jgi:hypothetical protein